MIHSSWRTHASVIALTAAMLGAGTLTFAAPAHAQETASPSAPAAETNGDTVVVRGIRNSLRSSMNVKRDAVNVVDAITAEDVGQFPDKNLGEALQRVTGVQISRQDGEGRGVSIRGGDPNQTRVEVNGSTAMSLTVGAGDRAVDFRDLPVEFISRLEVVKSVTPEMTEGGVGGTVRIVTRRPFDSRRPFLAASAQGVYSNLSETWDPKLAIIGSRLFADDTIGILVSATFEDRHLFSNNARTTGWIRREDAARERADGPTGRDSDLNGDGVNDWMPEIPRLIMDRRDTRRTALNSVLEWRPNSDLQLFAELTYATATEDVYSQFLQLSGSAGEIDYANSAVGDDNTASHIELVSTAAFPIDLTYRNILGSLTRTQYTSAVGGKWNIGQWTFDGRASYSKGDVHNDEINSTAYVFGVPRAIVDYTGSQGSPQFTFPGLDVTTGQGVNQLDAIYNPRDNIADEAAVRLNATWTPVDSLWVNNVKFGIGRSEVTNDSLLYQRTIRLAGRTPMPTSSGATVVHAVPAATLQSIVNANSTVNDIPFFSTGDLGYSGGVRQWLDNTYDTYYATIAASGTTMDVMATNPNAGTMGSYQNFLDTWTVEENTDSAYLQMGFRFDEDFPFPIDGVIGGRYIETDTRSSGFNRVQNGSTVTFVPGVREGSYSEFLPSFNMRMKFVPNRWVGRFTATKVMSRPAPSQLALRRSTDIVGLTGSRGNPELLPFVATQFDLGLEHYINSDSFWSFTLFQKNISRFIVNQVGPEDVDGITYSISRPVNVDDPVKISGFEAGVQYALDFLPAPFNGLGILANVTVQEDKGYKGTDLLTGATLPYPGLSKTSYNTSVYYETDRMSARLSYNWRDKWLITPAGRGNLPEFNKAYGSLDAAVNFNVNPNWTVFLEGVNLTDQVRVEYNADARVIGNETFGSRIFLGIRYKQ